MKISKDKVITLFIMMLMLPYFTSYLSLTNEKIYKITIIFRIISFIIITSIYTIESFKKLYISKLSILSIVSMIILFIATCVNGGDLSKYLGYLITCIGVLFIFEYCSKKNIYNLLTAIVYVFRIMVYINFIIMLLYPEGIYKVYDIYSSAVTRYNFLGLDNQIGPYFISLIGFSLCREYFFRDSTRLMCKIDISICIISIIYLWSATTIIGLFIFILFILFQNKFPNIVNLKNGYKFVFFIFLFFVVFRWTSTLSPIFKMVLNKDFTLTGRIFIWQEAISMIFSKPLLGYGIQSSPNIVYFYIYNDYRTAHNEYLQVLLNGGLFYFLFFILQLVIVQNNIIKSCKRNLNYIMMSSTIISLLVMMIAESYGQMLCLYIVLYFSYYFFRNKDYKKTN